MVALVITAVTSSHSKAASAGPTSMGERRRRGLRLVPSTQATSPSVRAPNRWRSSARWVAAVTALVVRLARSRSRPPSPAPRSEPCDPPARSASVTRRARSAARVSSSSSSRSSGRAVPAARGRSSRTRSPTRSATISCSRSPSSASVSSCSAPRRSTRERPVSASVRNRPAVTSTPRLEVMTSSSWWASSKTTASWSGSTARPLARWAP